MELIKGLVLIAGTGISCALFLAGVKVFLAAKGDYDANRVLTGTLRNALRGELRTSRGGTRDGRVKAGLAIDRKTNRWVEQGGLSEESIDTVFH